MTATSSLTEQLGEITVNVFDAMLGVPVHPVKSFHNEAVLAGAESYPFDVEGRVAFSGAWNGAVLVRCSLEQARQWAKKLMSTPDPNEDDLREAVAELTNMVAGNFKALLPPKNVLGLPDVSVGSLSAVDQTSGTVVSAVLLYSPFGSFRTLLTQHRTN